MEQPYLYYITWGEGGTPPTPSILPKELQACEYIQGDGNSYIRLPYKCDDFVRIEGYGKFISNERKSIFGSIDGSNIVNIFVNNNVIMYHFFQSIEKSSGIVWNNDFHFILTKINGTIKINNYIAGALVYNNMQSYLHLFTATGSNCSQSLINSFNLQDGNYENIADLYACYVKSGKTFIDNKSITCPAGTPGMYDVVNNIFYTNDGTGAFTVGPDIIL